MTQRDNALAQIVSEIIVLTFKPVVLVAVDGVDGAGKTCFADELKDLLGEIAIRASVDSFHNPRSVRYAPGKHSPQGFFRNSFNYVKLIELLLGPLSSTPPEPYCCAFFDHETDTKLPLDWKEPPEQGILIFDGIFAHRPELADFWDYSVFLDVSTQVSVKRCVDREGATGVSYDPQHPIHNRYVEGQAIYLATCDPLEKCTRVITNEDLNAPRVVA